MRLTLRCFRFRWSGRRGAARATVTAPTIVSTAAAAMTWALLLPIAAYAQTALPLPMTVAPHTAAVPTRGTPGSTPGDAADNATGNASDASNKAAKEAANKAGSSAGSTTDSAMGSGEAGGPGRERQAISSPAAVEPALSPDMNETVVRIPLRDSAPSNATADGSLAQTATADIPASNAASNANAANTDSDLPPTASLEATLFKPDGDGPFPVVIFNHGKDHGDPRGQPRSRPLSLAREFVRRGYMVIAPNREGFGESDGRYTEDMCAIDAVGLAQARDVAATVHYVQALPYADASRILIVGASQGALPTFAYGAHAAPGVRGLVNFSGGMRQDGCKTWQQAMIDAFSDYGLHTRLPSLWLYGDNDRYWPIELARQLVAAYRAGGGDATWIDFGRYKDNAHALVGDRDGVAVWWPAIEGFLRRLGLPVAVRFHIPEVALPPASGFASISDVDKVPYIDDNGRAGYRTFLQQYSTRAFALSKNGGWSWAEGGDDPLTVALENCQRNSQAVCHLYAVDNAVVWDGN